MTTNSIFLSLSFDTLREPSDKDALIAMNYHVDYKVNTNLNDLRDLNFTVDKDDLDMKNIISITKV